MSFKINKDECSGCGVCSNTCQQSAIVEDDTVYRIVADKCTDCGDCADACPVSCISGEKK